MASATHGRAAPFFLCHLVVHGSTGSAGVRDCIARAYSWMSDVTGGVEVDLATAVIEHRKGSGEAEASSAGQVADTALLEAVRWRTFRFYQGQRHYSGQSIGPQ